MIFKYNNKEEMLSLRIHDFAFAGFSYDYNEKEIYLKINNDFQKKYWEIKLQKVYFTEMQSGSFWGRGSNILGLQLSEYEKNINKLKVLEKEKKSINNIDYSKCIDFYFYFNTGDELSIVCETVEVIEL